MDYVNLNGLCNHDLVFLTTIFMAEVNRRYSSVQPDFRDTEIYLDSCNLKNLCVSFSSIVNELRDSLKTSDFKD